MAIGSSPNSIGTVVPPWAGTTGGGGGGGNADCATAAFVNADLAAGVYTFNHALNDQFPVITVFDGDNQVVAPDDITMTDANNAAVDLSSFGTIVGTWHVTAVGCPP